MHDFIYQNKNSLTKKTCNDIIDLFESLECHHRLGAIGPNNKTDINLKNCIDLDLFKLLNEDLKNTLINEIKKNLKVYVNKCSTNSLINELYNQISFDTFLIHKYIKNTGKFAYHQDFFIESEINKYRILNYMWYLNDVHEGGETEFFGSYLIKAEIGKMIIFPSDWMFPHCGKTPISNDKYVLTGWLYVDF
jgi:hypothetical protein